MYQVFILAEAEGDILDISDYIARADGPDRADHVLNKLQETCATLSDVPQRGHIPSELEWLGIRDFREIHFKPYRIVYQVVKTKVFIHAVLDGRRSLQELLERRLLR